MARDLRTRFLEGVDRLAERLSRTDAEFNFSGPATGRRAVALTFDDGPSVSNTPPLLDLFGAHESRATFFVEGDCIPGREDILRRAVAEGHELGNHSYVHPHTIRLDTAALRAELLRANDALRPFAEVRLVRPPYGKDRRRVAAVGRELGLQMALWSVDSRDTWGVPAGEIVDAVLQGATPGAIVLMHDGGDRRPATLEAAARIVPDLRERGFELVTVSELLAPVQELPDPRSSASASSREPRPSQ